MPVDSVVAAVRADLLRRSEFGITKYGVTLGEQVGRPHRDRLQHAYEEALDLANYLKWAIMEIDGGSMQTGAPVHGGEHAPVNRE